MTFFKTTPEAITPPPTSVLVSASCSYVFRSQTRATAASISIYARRTASSTSASTPPTLASSASAEPPTAADPGQQPALGLDLNSPSSLPLRPAPSSEPTLARDTLAAGPFKRMRVACSSTAHAKMAFKENGMAH